MSPLRITDKEGMTGIFRFLKFRLHRDFYISLAFTSFCILLISAWASIYFFKNPVWQILFVINLLVTLLLFAKDFLSHNYLWRILLLLIVGCNYLFYLLPLLILQRVSIDSDTLYQSALANQIRLGLQNQLIFAGDIKFNYYYSFQAVIANLVRSFSLPTYFFSLFLIPPFLIYLSARSLLLLLRSITGDQFSEKVILVMCCLSYAVSNSVFSNPNYVLHGRPPMQALVMISPNTIIGTALFYFYLYLKRKNELADRYGKVLSVIVIGAVACTKVHFLYLILFMMLTNKLLNLRKESGGSYSRYRPLEWIFVSLPAVIGFRFYDSDLVTFLQINPGLFAVRSWLTSSNTILVIATLVLLKSKKEMRTFEFPSWLGMTVFFIICLVKDAPSLGQVFVFPFMYVNLVLIFLYFYKYSKIALLKYSYLIRRLISYYLVWFVVDSLLEYRGSYENQNWKRAALVVLFACFIIEIWKCRVQSVIRGKEIVVIMLLGSLINPFGSLRAVSVFSDPASVKEYAFSVSDLQTLSNFADLINPEGVVFTNTVCLNTGNKVSAQQSLRYCDPRLLLVSGLIGRVPYLEGWTYAYASNENEARSVEAKIKELKSILYGSEENAIIEVNKICRNKPVYLVLDNSLNLVGLGRFIGRSVLISSSERYSLYSYACGG